METSPLGMEYIVLLTYIKPFHIAIPKKEKESIKNTLLYFNAE
jgi:hypothetical protein